MLNYHHEVIKEIAHLICNSFTWSQHEIPRLNQIIVWSIFFPSNNKKFQTAPLIHFEPMLSMSSIFSVINNYQSFIHCYLLFIHIYTNSQNHYHAIAFTIRNWKVYKRLWYHTVRHYFYINLDIILLILGDAIWVTKLKISIRMQVLF